MNVISYYVMCVYWYVSDLISKLKSLYFIHQYGRHLKKRIQKNDFGRREEW